MNWQKSRKKCLNLICNVHFPMTQQTKGKNKFLDKINVNDKYWNKFIVSARWKTIGSKIYNWQ